MKRAFSWIKRHMNEDVKNRLIFWGLFAASLLFAFFWNGVAVYTVFYIFLATVLFSLLCLIYVSARVKYFQSLPEVIINKGESVNYEFRIRNIDPIFYSLMRIKLTGDYSIFEGGERYDYVLRPFAEFIEQIPVYFRYRGVYEFGVDILEISDVLGIFHWKNKMEDRLRVIIYPRIIDLVNFRPAGNDQMTLSLRYLKNVEEITAPCDIRTYQYGDPINRIHWKLFARKNELLTKVFESGNRNAVGVFLDLSSAGEPVESRYNAEDRCIEAAISLIRCFLKNQMPVHLMYGEGETLKTLREDNLAGFGEVYELLSRIKFASKVNFFGALERRLTHDDNYQDILVITIDMPRTMADSMLRMTNAGRDMTVINILSGEKLEGGTLVESHHKYGAEVLKIYSIGVQEDLRSALERLS